MSRRSKPGVSWTDVVLVGTILSAAMLFIGGGVGWLISGGSSSASPSTHVPASAQPVAVDPQVASGAHAFTQFACAQCHGMQGKGGVSPDVPGLQAIASTLTPKQLTSIIEHGAGVSSNPSKPFMPVWKGVISPNQIDALVAYMKAGFPAVSNTDPVQIPADQGDIVAGMALYEQYGCVNCHGPNALGGVPNPDSPDKSIPPLVGADFHAEFDSQAMAEMIRSGSVLGKAPIVSMPHWGTIVTDQQIQQLIAYINSL